MANTVIQIKRSTSTSAPAALSAAELAYSYQSDKLFIGNALGTEVIEIGGRYYLNVAVQAYNSANAAFDKANAANLLAFQTNGAVTSSNAAITAAYDKANSANLLAYAALPNTSGVSFAGDLFFPTGNVGIGTTSTTNKLQVTGSGPTFAYISSSTNGNAGIRFAGAGDRGKIYTDSLYNLLLEPNAQYGNVNIILKAANDTVNTTKVGINTTSPTSTLHVNGAANITSTLIVSGISVIPGITAAYDKANSANILAFQTNGAVTTANAAITASYDKANSANILAFQVGGAVTTANAAITAAYDKANAANILAFQVGGAVTTANAIAIAAYANANSKFSSSGGTISGDVNIIGNLTLSGNTMFANVSTMTIRDPLIYLASNNYSGDIVDIGFIGNYVNATGVNVHTGFIRDAISKEYYAFHSYDKEPDNNVVDPSGNNFTLAVINAALRTSNLALGGVNAITWITASYDKANSANLLAFQTNGAVTTANAAITAAYDKANSANLLAFSISGAVSTSNAAITAAYDKANSANILAFQIGGGLTTANAAITAAYDKANAANILAFQVGGAVTTANAAITASYDKANSANILAFQVGGAVTTANAAITAAFLKANNALGSSANTQVIFNDAGVGAGSAGLTYNKFTQTLSTDTLVASNLVISGSTTLAANTINVTGNLTVSGSSNLGNILQGVWNASTIKVPFGGTGMVTFTTNGIVYGNGAGDLKVTSAGTEGQVLQASATGVPQFAMLDGGNF